MKRKKKIKAKYCKIRIYQFYEELFSKKVSNSNEVIAHCLKDISLPKLTKEQNKQCEDELTENGVKDALQNIICNKTPGNDRLTFEFYKAFWSELKTPLLLSYQKGFLSGELSISQKQVVINPFVPNAPFLYALKKSENLTVFYETFTEQNG